MFQGATRNDPFLHHGELEMVHHRLGEAISSDGYLTRAIEMSQADNLQKDKAQLTRMDEKGEMDGLLSNIQFEDTQEIQVLQDKCQQLGHVFDMDRTVLQDMYGRIQTLPVINDALDETESDFISALIAEANIQMGRVNSLLKRLDGTVALVFEHSR
jgi:hypothetical protein